MQQVSVSLIYSTVLHHGLHGKPAFSLSKTVRAAYLFLENSLEFSMGQFLECTQNPGLLGRGARSWVHITANYSRYGDPFLWGVDSSVDPVSES